MTDGSEDAAITVPHLALISRICALSYLTYPVLSCPILSYPTMTYEHHHPPPACHN